MSHRLSLLSCVVGLCACTANAPTPEDINASLRDATAAAIAVQAPSDISIENPQRLTARWEWRAVYAGKTYACNADDRLRLPDCLPLS